MSEMQKTEPEDGRAETNPVRLCFEKVKNRNL